MGKKGNKPVRSKDPLDQKELVPYADLNDEELQALSRRHSLFAHIAVLSAYVAILVIVYFAVVKGASPHNHF